jgi:hypothetical protein
MTTPDDPGDGLEPAYADWLRQQVGDDVTLTSVPGTFTDNGSIDDKVELMLVNHLMSIPADAAEAV